MTLQAILLVLTYLSLPMTTQRLTHMLVTGALLASIAVPVLAQAKEQDKMLTATQIQCISTAVDKRDTAIAGTFDTLKTAVNTRKDALKAAWALTDTAARKTALKAAWKAYKDTIKTTRTARKDAWKTFRTDVKACGTSASSEDGQKGSVDQGL